MWTRNTSTNRNLARTAALAASLALFAACAGRSHAAASTIYYVVVSGAYSENQMNPDGTGKTLLFADTTGTKPLFNPSTTLHNGKRWFVGLAGDGRTLQFASQ